MILEAGARYAQRMREIAEGTEPFTVENVYSSHGLDRLRMILEVLKAHGVTGDNLPLRLREFLESDTFKDFPAERISSLMWAVIGQRAALGQRKQPNRGMVNDIDVVSSFLPYCDAMLLDNECRGLFGNIPRKHALDYPTRLFSRNKGQEFLAYLQEIEADADATVLASVREVYGNDWPTPYLTMYEKRERRNRQ